MEFVLLYPSCVIFSSASVLEVALGVLVLPVETDLAPCCLVTLHIPMNSFFNAFHRRKLRSTVFAATYTARTLWTLSLISSRVLFSVQRVVMRCVSSSSLCTLCALETIFMDFMFLSTLKRQGASQHPFQSPLGLLKLISLSLMGSCSSKVAQAYPEITFQDYQLLTSSSWRFC